MHNYIESKLLFFSEINKVEKSTLENRTGKVGPAQNTATVVAAAAPLMLPDYSLLLAI